MAGVGSAVQAESGQAERGPEAQGERIKQSKQQRTRKLASDKKGLGVSTHPSIPTDSLLSLFCYLY